MADLPIRARAEQGQKVSSDGGTLLGRGRTEGPGWWVRIQATCGGWPSLAPDRRHAHVHLKDSALGDFEGHDLTVVTS